MWDSTESPSQPLTQLCQSSKVSLEDDFIKLDPRSSIEGLKDFKQVQIFFSMLHINIFLFITFHIFIHIVAFFIFQESTFVVKAIIKHVLDHDDWWYTTCICKKAVYPYSKIFFCEKCNKHDIKVTPR